MSVRNIAARYLATPLRWSRRILGTLTGRRQSDVLIRRLERAVQDLSTKLEVSTLELLAVTAMVVNLQYEQKRILERLEKSHAINVGLSKSDK